MNAQRSLSILLADDDQDDCLLFKEALRELPLKTTVFVVRDGNKLMEVLNSKIQQLPDVLFMDLCMPVKDGFECMCEIRSSDLLRHLPVVILSTHSNQEIITHVYNAGASYYVRKPGEFSELKLLIYKAIKLVLLNEDEILIEERIEVKK